MSNATNGSDRRIVLNVGGRLFETTTSTLANASTYFAAEFSENWSQDATEQYFIDQDPDAFAVLLSFMRRGFVRGHQLSDDVLFQAEFFGIETLVNEVKIFAYQTHNPRFAGTDDEAVTCFEQEFGSVIDATANGFLPALLCETIQPTGQLEYASIYLHFNEQRCDGSVIPCHAGLCFKLFNSSPRTESPEPAPDAGGFMNPIFALNFLGKYGFRLTNPHLQNYACSKTGSNPKLALMQPLNFPLRPSLETRGYHLGEWIFCRGDRPRKEEERSVISPASIHEPDRPIEYASLLWTRTRETFITAAVGETISFQRLGGAAVRNVGIIRLRNIVAAFQWLERNGFTKPEEEIERIFESANTLKLEQLNELLDKSFPEYEGGRTLIFSRPLREHDPLHYNVIPLAFSAERSDLPHNIVFPPLSVLSRLPFA